MTRAVGSWQSAVAHQGWGQRCGYRVVSGSKGLARSNGFGRGLLQADCHFSTRRAVWSELASSPCLHVNPRQRRRRIWPEQQRRLQPILESRSGVSQRAGNTSIACGTSGVGQCGSHAATSVFLRRSGPDAASANSLHRTKLLVAVLRDCRLPTADCRTTLNFGHADV
jgi:hypothetical protein